MPTTTTTWRSLGVSRHELRLAYTLPTGQAFGWKWKDGEWRGAIGKEAVYLREAPNTFEAEWRSTAEIETQLKKYFQLETPLEPLYKEWSEKCPRLQQVGQALEGVRVMNQDPVECLFSFICSSNNNIHRITLMLDKLRSAYGDHIVDDIYAFPELPQIASISESDLRRMGFGYRAPFIVKTANKLLELGGREYLESLDREALMEFPGVGPKVADCVSLFSLSRTDSVPVDTHVWRLARRDYNPGLKDALSLTPALYHQVAETFRSTFGSYAGWAHSLLFVAELPALHHRLPTPLVQDMLAFKKHEKDLLISRRSQRRQAAKDLATTTPSSKKKKRVSPPSLQKMTTKKKKQKRNSTPPNADDDE